MPQHKSAEKRVRTNERDRVKNVGIRSHLRKSLTAQRENMDVEDAKTNLPAMVSQIDKAKKRGIIPSRRADRLKSRLARHAARIANAAKAEATK